MKKLIFSIVGVIGLTLIISGTVFAQGMMGLNEMTSDGHTAREESEGKVVWEKLQAREASCADLSDEDFGALGEYFMGLMLGTSHEAMNNMMIRAHGEAGEEQMHVLMGKRVSGCDAAASADVIGGAWMPMMPMMGGGVSSFGLYQGNTMMSGFVPFGSFGGIFAILWWLLAIVGLVAIVTWLLAQQKG